MSSTSKIDGTIDAVWLKRRGSAVAVYERIDFKLADGTTRSLGKTVVAPAVADRLVPGRRGRFYLYNAIDHKGVHGVRDESGEIFGFPKVNERAILFLVVINLVWLATAVLGAGLVPVFPLAAIFIGLPVWFLYRDARVGARRQFEADRAFAPPPPPGLTPAL
jgi:hypothetical protein